MATATELVTTTGWDFIDVAITLSGKADVLVFSGCGEFSTPATWGVRLAKGGSTYDFTLAISTSLHGGRGAAIYYLTGALALGSGAATISRITRPDACGGTLYELIGVIDAAPEVTNSFASPGADATSSLSFVTVTNGAHVIAECVQLDAETGPVVNGIDGVLDSYIAHSHYYLGGTGEGVCGAAGSQTATFTLSAANRWAMCVAAWSSDGTAVQTDVDVTFEGLQDGSSVYLYEVAHPQIWSVDFTATTPANADGTYVSFEVQGASATTKYEAWCDLDDGSDAPHSATAWAGSTAYDVGYYVTNDTNHLYICTTAGTSAASGGPTGTGSGITDGDAEWDYVATFFWWDVATGDTTSDIATAFSAVVDALTDVSAAAVGAVATVTNARNGATDAPIATMPASVTVIQAGGSDDGTTEIDSVTSSSGDWVATATVEFPRLATVQMLSTAYKNRRFQITLTREDATVPAGALQTEDRVYANPS